MRTSTLIGRFDAPDLIRTSTTYAEADGSKPTKESIGSARCSSLCDGRRECFEPNQFCAVTHQRQERWMEEATIARMRGISFGAIWIVIFGLHMLSGM